MAATGYLLAESRLIGFAMRRVQLNLEKWQYQALQVRAEQQKRSISELVREILRQTLAQSSRAKNHNEVEGIGADSIEEGRAHDEFLSGDDSDLESG